MASAEFAVAMPAVVVVLVLALSALVTVMDQVRCVDAARATARALARGDDHGSAMGQGQRLAPSAATFTVATGPTDVEVVVTGRPAPALRWLGSRATPAGRAVARLEDTGTGGPAP